MLMNIFELHLVLAKGFDPSLSDGLPMKIPKHKIDKVHGFYRFSSKYDLFWLGRDLNRGLDYVDVYIVAMRRNSSFFSAKSKIHTLCLPLRIFQRYSLQINMVINSVLIIIDENR